MEKYINRLTREWLQHGKIIIAVDFDSTLSPWPTLDNPQDIERTISAVKLAAQTGAYIVLFTACREEKHEELLLYCDSIGVQIDSINRAPIEGLPFGNSSKVYANIFLDDRAGLCESLAILEVAMSRVLNTLLEQSKQA